MTVVINEFEVVAQPSAEAPPPERGGERAAAPAPASSTPADIERVLRRAADRLARVSAS